MVVEGGDRGWKATATGMGFWNEVDKVLIRYDSFAVNVLLGDGKKSIEPNESGFVGNLEHTILEKLLKPIQVSPKILTIWQPYPTIKSTHHSGHILQFQFQFNHNLSAPLPAPHRLPPSFMVMYNVHDYTFVISYSPFVRHLCALENLSFALKLKLYL